MVQHSKTWRYFKEQLNLNAKIKYTVHLLETNQNIINNWEVLGLKS